MPPPSRAERVGSRFLESKAVELRTSGASSSERVHVVVTTLSKQPECDVTTGARRTDHTDSNVMTHNDPLHGRRDQRSGEQADPNARRFSGRTLPARCKWRLAASRAISAKGVRRYISRRPARARPSVTSSAYSRSPPTGSPLASRVTCTFPRRRSAR